MPPMKNFLLQLLLHSQSLLQFHWPPPHIDVLGLSALIVHAGALTDGVVGVIYAFGVLVALRVRIGFLDEVVQLVVVVGDLLPAVEDIACIYC